MENNLKTKKQQQIKKTHQIVELNEILPPTLSFNDNQVNNNNIKSSIIQSPLTTTAATKLSGKRQSILSPISSSPSSSSSFKTKLKMPPIKEIQQQKKDKKRERWLLTRKTWKYMTDAGRKLIPDNNNGCTIDDIKKCEKNFHLLCTSEPKFILWRRKASYPGAMGTNNNQNNQNGKKRLKNFLTRSYKSINNNHNNNNNIDKEQFNNAEQIINILKDYLCLDDTTKKTTTLLSTKTIRPDQTQSLSSKRPINNNNQNILSSSISLLEQQKLNSLNTTEKINELLDKLRKYSEKCDLNNSNILLNINNITPEILDNKILLKKIYNELKKQQLNRILGKHSTTTTSSLNLSNQYSSSLSNLLNFKNHNIHNQNHNKIYINNDNYKNNNNYDSIININNNQLYNNNDNNNKMIINKIITYNQHGTQTDFINLNELKLLTKEYNLKKNLLLNDNQYLSPTDDDSDKGSGSGNSYNNYQQRKSSIDNEDVSQSVSDTIKRYLRMARKKSVVDDNNINNNNNNINNQNRFKRVNYDRNLRNIRAKGEIIPPGMDDNNNKQTQTLDSWPLILLNYIKGINNDKLLYDSHIDWDNQLKLRIKIKNDYEIKLQLNEQQHQSIGSGILHTGQQFLSNLWHGHNNNSGGSGGSGGNVNASDNTHQPSPANSTISISSAPVGCTKSGFESTFDTMQKSKSSSNVGQFVSKKIWKTRSKSQTRQALTNINKPDWTPQGNCVWTSANGKRLILTDTKLNDLTEIERTILYRVAIEKINQLNIGVSVTAPIDNGSTTGSIQSKSQKRRPLLIKRKAVTTSFFDSGKNKNVKEVSNGLIFGVTLEKCLENDQRICCKDSDRRSKNSISSLIADDSKGIGSYDSLLTKSINNLNNSNQSSSSSSVDRGILSSAIGFGVNNLINAATMKISRSQSDIRRNSQQYDENLINNNNEPPPMTSVNRNNGGQRVPSIVISCIKHIEENGLNTVGIFRVSTSKKRVRQLKDDFDRGDINILDPEICPHDIATLLKEYFRDLPEPLLCRNLYKAFVKTQKIRNRRLQLEALSHLVQLLPVAHRDTLYILLKFLAKIVRYSDDVTSRDGILLSQGNKMDSNNLATVFAPNILRQITTSLSSSSNNNQQYNTTEQEIDEQLDVINVIRTMIDHYEELFKISAELIDEIYTNMLDTFPQQLDYLCEKRDIKNDDQMDSASSNTPLSSPPPILNLNQDGNLQHMFNKFSSDIGGNNHKLNTTIVNQTPKSLRRIYSREVVMHENAGKGGDQNDNHIIDISLSDGGGGGGGGSSGSNNSGARRRDRTSKMKYTSDNENDILRRRRRDRLLSGDSGGCDDNLNENDKNNNKNQRQISSLTNDYHSIINDGELNIKNNNKNQSILRCLSNDSSSMNIQKQQLQQQQQNHQLHQQQLERRLSTPQILQHNTGIVTATLKIPLQMQQQQQKFIDTGSYNNNNKNHGDGRLDLSDIPYIEDGTNGQDCGTSSGQQYFNRPITGSLSIGGNSSLLELNNNNNNNELLSKSQSFQIPIKYDGKLLNSITPKQQSTSFQQLPQAMNINKSNLNISNNNNNLIGGINKLKNSDKIATISGGGGGVGNIGDSALLSSSSSSNYLVGNRNNNNKHIEPKITPSITNIGGDLLKSKTADFERILTQNKKSNNNNKINDNIDNNLIIKPSSSIQNNSSTSIIIEGTTKNTNKSTQKSGTNKNGSQGQIYKRQELISSAKRTK